MKKRLASSIIRAAAGIVGLTLSPHVAAQERFSVDASAAVGVGNNPFMQAGDTPTTGSATISISPSYRLETERTSFAVDADATLTRYFQRYRNSDSFTLNGSGTHQLTERSSLNARLGYLNSVVGAFNDLGVVGGGISTGNTDPVVPGTGTGSVIVAPITPPVFGTVPDLTIDPSLGGIGQRRQSYTAGAGYATGLGARDRVTADLSVSAIRSGGRSFDDFNYVTQRLGYQRAINETWTATGDVSIGKVDYLGRRLGDATTLQPTVGVAYRVGADTSLNLSVGVSVVRSDLEFGGTRSSTQFSAQGSVCKQNSWSNACLSVSRMAVPSSLAGVRVQTAISLSGGMRLSERGSLSVGSSYSRAGEPLNDIDTGTFISGRTEYLSARAAYNHVLSQRLSGFVSVGAARAYGGFGAWRDASLEARVGVRVRFGDLR